MRVLLLGAWVCPAPLPAAAHDPPGPTPEIVVTATFRETRLGDLPASATVLDARTLQEVAVQHFEELVGQVPNLNLSGEGSRARYFQIRGIGEIEGYEGAPNPSVGFMLDDIDVSGLGAVATLFDVEQVEVLRGPQGTRFGANGLAGLINVRSRAPEAQPSLDVDMTGGSDGARAASLSGGGSVSGTDSAVWRLALNRYVSNGFRRNDALGRDDTYDRDELSARGRLGIVLPGGASVDLTVLHADIDNGYDAFAIENGFTTHSDKPGRDAQQTDALALRLAAELGDAGRLVSITSAARSDLVFSFDADWGNNAYWSELIGTPAVYDFTDATVRRRDTVTQELRWLSGSGTRVRNGDWVAGAYVSHLDEENSRTAAGECDGVACPGFAFEVNQTRQSRYRATNVALFGELDLPVAADTRLTVGLRAEQRRARYRDEVFRRTPRDRLIGGAVTLTHDFGAAASAWGRLARGYKAGGVNPSLAGSDIDAQLEFGPEALWSLEAGSRWHNANRTLLLDGSVFWQERRDLQIKVPQNPFVGDPTTFVFVTTNAESGRSIGAELSGRYQPIPALELYTSVGLLRTRLERVSRYPALEGRELAHAPRYTVAAGVIARRPSGWFARADVTGRDRFTIDYCQADDCRDPKLNAAWLLDLRLGRAGENWSAEIWARNALDERYAQRGFFFGNEPPDFTETLYQRLGDPRQVGVTLRYRR